jgi:hypothetical protein
MKRSQLLFLLVVLPLAVTAQDSTKIEVTLRLEKTEYLVGEHIWVFITCINQGSRTLDTDEDDLQSNLVITDSNGSQYQNTMEFSKAKFMNFHPGDTLSTFLDIDRYQNLKSHEKVQVRGIEDLKIGAYPIGKYTIYAKIPIYSEYGKYFESQRTEFEVVEPTGQAFQHLKQLNEAVKTRATHSKHSNKIFLNLLNEIKIPPYMEITYELFLEGFRCTSKAISDAVYVDYIERFFKEMPDSPLVPTALATMECRFRQKEHYKKARKYFAKLVKDYPNTRLAMIAQSRIANMDTLSVDYWAHPEKIPIKPIQSPW